MYLARIIIKRSAFGKLFGFATAKLLKRGYRDNKIRNTIITMADTRLIGKCNCNAGILWQVGLYTLAVVRFTGVYLLDFFCAGIQLMYC